VKQINAADILEVNIKEFENHHGNRIFRRPRHKWEDNIKMYSVDTLYKDVNRF
jgi:hypothetical protein